MSDFLYFYHLKNIFMSAEIIYQKTRKKRTGEAIAAIIWNLIILWVINKVPAWDLPFINEHYETVLWILNLNVIAQIAGYALILFLNFRWLWYLVRTVLDTVGLVTLLALYFIYPFDFSGLDSWTWMDVVLPILFIIGMVGCGIGIVVNVLKLIFRSGKQV
jgi:hypothetical protein